MSEPEPSVPAIMRNDHEVLRNDLGHVLAPLADAGDVAAFASAWQAYCTVIAVRAAMEDGVDGAGGGSAAMLDHHFDGAAPGPFLLPQTMRLLPCPCQYLSRNGFL